MAATSSAYDAVAVSRALIANILESVDQGLTEAGMPLSDEQRQFFADAARSMS